MVERQFIMVGYYSSDERNKSEEKNQIIDLERQSILERYYFLGEEK